MFPTAKVNYAALNREEAAMDLRDCLRQAGFQAEAVYRRESADHLREVVLLEQPPFRGIQMKTWAEAREIVHQRRTEGAKVMLLNPQAKLPTRSSPASAGLDLSYDGRYAQLWTVGNVPGEDGVHQPAPLIHIRPGERVILSTGVAIQPPQGYYSRVAPRSGMAVKGFDVSAGVIDADYTGEIKVILSLHIAALPATISTGDRIAQLIFEKCSLAELIQVNALDMTTRQDGGFGSTGA